MVQAQSNLLCLDIYIYLYICVCVCVCVCVKCIIVVFLWQKKYVGGILEGLRIIISWPTECSLLISYSGKIPIWFNNKNETVTHSVVFHNVYDLDKFKLNPIQFSIHCSCSSFSSSFLPQKVENISRLGS